MDNNRWSQLSMAEKNQLFGIYASKGYTDLASIIKHYNSFTKGGQMDIDREDADGSKEEKSNKGHVTFGTYDEYGNIRPMYRLNEVNVSAIQPYRTPEQEAQVTRERNMYFDAMRHFNYGNQDAEGLKETYAKYPELKSYLRRIGMSENAFMTAATGRDYETNSYERERTRQFNKDIWKAEAAKANKLMQSVSHQNPEDQKLAAIMTGILGGVTGTGILTSMYTMPTLVGNATNIALQGSKTALGAAGKMMLPSTWSTAAGLSSGFGAGLDAAMFSGMAANAGKELTTGSNWQPGGRYNNDNWGGFQGGANLLLDATMLAPVFDVAKGGVKLVGNAANFARNWRLTVPEDASRYYRIVDNRAIDDAIQSGVIRGPGATEDLANAFRQSVKSETHSPLLIKAHEYPMFAKGKPWQGSTARIDKGKPSIIRSKKDTGPIIWQESNKDFRHKGHSGIFRPSFYGDLNASPTQYFEYWEPKKFGYLRHDFPTLDQAMQEARNARIERPTVTKLALNSDDRFIQGVHLRSSLDGTEIAPFVDAHGIAKGNELEILEDILNNGIKKDKNFYTAPLAKHKDLIGMGFDNGTASSTAYTDGMFILASKPNGSLISDGIDAVLINTADRNFALKLKKYLSVKYPKYKFLTYEEAPKYYKGDTEYFSKARELEKKAEEEYLKKLQEQSRQDNYYQINVEQGSSGKELPPPPEEVNILFAEGGHLNH